MRYLLMSTVAAGALLGTAVAPVAAADLPVRVAPAPAPVYVAPAFTWTGFYIGLNAGAAWPHHDDGFDHFGAFRYANLNPPVVIHSTGFGCGAFSCNDDRNVVFTGGLTWGSNWQFGALVVGLESDLNYIDLDDRHGNGFDAIRFSLPTLEARAAAGITFGPLALGGAGNPYTATFFGDGGDSNWFTTTRLRVGFAWDRVLFYGTGGVAWHSTDDHGGVVVIRNAQGAVATTLGGAPAIYGSFGDDDNGWGWAAGAGIEVAVADNVTVKLEYLHVAFDGGDGRGHVDPVLTSYFGTPFVLTDDNNRNVDIVRAGVNLKFGSLFNIF